MNKVYLLYNTDHNLFYELNDAQNNNQQIPLVPHKKKSNSQKMKNTKLLLQ